MKMRNIEVILDHGLGSKYRDSLRNRGFRVTELDTCCEPTKPLKSEQREQILSCSALLTTPERQHLYIADQSRFDYDLIIISSEAEAEKIGDALARWTAEFNPVEQPVLWRLEIAADGSTAFTELARAEQKEWVHESILRDNFIIPLSKSTKNLIASITRREAAELRRRYGIDNKSDLTLEGLSDDN